MKLQIINEATYMQWVNTYKGIFPDAQWNLKPENGHDCNLFMWCNQDVSGFIDECPHKNNIVFIRRYEWYAGYWRKVDWSKVKAVIMVNDYLADQFQRATGVKPHVIYNGIDASKWKYKECKRGGGNKIAVVGFVNQKKNLPLAIQILAVLPENYELHIAGEIQDLQVYDYICNLAPAIKRRVILHGAIPHESMDWWLDDKDYLLSTAISEGCPNNVIEAMAKGIKPIVHNWPGAKEQFGSFVFDTVEDAYRLIHSETNNRSDVYRDIAINKFGLSNYEKVRDIVYG